MRHRLMVIYWRIVKRLFPAYYERRVKYDIDQLCDIFMRDTPLQKRLRGNQSDFSGGTTIYPPAPPVGINETPRWD